jgi:hypothetical protein
MQANDGPPDLASQRNFRERPIFAANGNDHISRLHNEDIPRMAHPRRDCDADEGVGSGAVCTGQDTEGAPAGIRGPAAGCFHHAAQTTAHQQRPNFGNPAAHLLSQSRHLILMVASSSSPAHRNDRRSLPYIHNTCLDQNTIMITGA